MTNTLHLFAEQYDIASKTIRTPVPAPLTGMSWYESHHALVLAYSSRALAHIDSISNYEGQPNSYYLVIAGDHEDIFQNSYDTSFWSKIPESSKETITKNNIPILVWFPLETVAQATLKDWTLFSEMRDQSMINHANCSVIVFSLTGFKNEFNCSAEHERIGNDILYVQSIGFLTDVWLRVNTHGNNSNTIDIGTYDGYPVTSIVSHLQKTKKYDFLCLNRSTKQNRVFLLQSLHNTSSLWDNNLISAHCVVDTGGIHYFIQDIINNLAVAEKKLIDTNYDPSYNRLILLLDQLQISSTSDIEYKLNQFINQEDISDTVFFIVSLLLQTLDSGVFTYKKLDNVDPDNTPLNFLGQKSWYTDSWFSLISETYWLTPSFSFGSNAPVVTEKTVKAIINHHPFIIFGSPGYTTFLSSLGFKTFDQSLLGLPEDFSIGNISFFERLHQLLTGLKKFQLISHEEKIYRYNRLADDLVHNYQHLQNTDWLKIQTNMLLNPAYITQSSQ